MKAIKQSFPHFFLFALVFSLFSMPAVQAQQTDKKIEITIKRVDENGQEFQEVIVLEGEDAKNVDVDEIIKREIGDEDFEIDVQIEDATESAACCSPEERAKCCPSKAGMQKKGVLGIVVDDSKANEVKVVTVKAGSAAEKINLQQGDVIKTVNNTPVENYDMLVGELSQFNAGDKVEIGFLHKNKLEKAEATLQNQRFATRKKRNCCPEGQKRSPKAHLGVYLKRTVVKGAAVSEIMENSPAAEAGLMPEDVIVKIDKKSIDNVDDLIRTVAKHQPGDAILVKFLRNGKKQKANITLAENPEKRWGCSETNAKEDGAKKIKKQITIRKKSEENNAIIMDNSLNFEHLDIFPNPTDSRFTLDFRLPDTDPVKINISDMNGKTILAESLENFNGTFTNEYDLSNAPQGIYLINIVQNNRVFTEKLYLNQ